jgi:hypothetical protein
MNRRDALKSLIALSGSVTVFGADRFLQSETATTPKPVTAAAFTPELLALIEEIAETILPATPDSGGAKDAKLGAFMQEIVIDYYTAEEQQQFIAAAPAINADAKLAHPDRGYMDLTPAEREALLMTYENAPETPAGYSMIKQLVIWGYFTSEVGQTQARAYLPVPTRYEGDIPLQPGQKAWAQ